MPAMRRRPWLLPLLALTLVGCVRFGQAFPSPEPASIRIGVTNKAALERVFGSPYQVGIDSGDQTWRWFYVERSAGREVTKDLMVRFNPDGTVKAYSFTSNFPEDMARLK
jgi:outer membrane protein assembly factor BamE (lipoprotein component of BamABCDE complex)